MHWKTWLNNNPGTIADAVVGRIVLVVTRARVRPAVKPRRKSGANHPRRAELAYPVN